MICDYYRPDRLNSGTWNISLYSFKDTSFFDNKHYYDFTTYGYWHGHTYD